MCLKASVGRERGSLRGRTGTLQPRRFVQSQPAIRWQVRETVRLNTDNRTREEGNAGENSVHGIA